MQAKSRIASLLMLFLASGTILLGVLFFDDRKYYFVSLLVILYSMVPFFLKFERRKPEARELILVAVLIAIAVAGRAAFFMLPQFKPVIAILIISAVSFGGEVGFLVGSMTALISNFFFGMGPHTPWQMFALGLIGFLAGYLAEKGLLQQTKKALSMYGALATFLIYGGIMDFSTVLLWTQDLSTELVLATYVAGLPFNFMHAGATVIFLLLFSGPFLEKLSRIKVKYGLFDIKRNSFHSKIE